MILNNMLRFWQKLFLPVYNKSLILQHIDILVLLNVILLVVSSAFCNSDNIGNFAIFIIILTVIKLLTKPGEQFSLIKGDKFLLLYFIFALISLAGSSLFILSLKGFCKLIVYLGFYVSMVHFIKDNKFVIKYIFLLLGVLTLSESVIAFYQNFISVSEISGWQDTSRLNPEEVITRVYGSLKPYNPNLFGGYLVSVIPTSLIGIFLPFKNHSYKLGFVGIMCFLSVIVSIILTGCRGAYIALFFELLLLVIFTYRLLRPLYKKLFKLFISFFSLVVALILVSIPAIKARIFSIFAMRCDSSNSFRFNVYNSCLQMLKDNWLLGIGMGNQNFREIYGLYMKTGYDALSAYNIYLETAVESGIFSLIAFVLFIYYNLSNAVKFIWNKNNIKSFYLLIATLSVIGILIHGFVDTVFFRPQIQFVFWIMIAIIRVLTTSGSLCNVRRNRN